MASTDTSGPSAPPSEPESSAAVSRSAPSSPTKKVRMPATVAETITAGKSLRRQKNSLPRRKAKAPPKPAFPRGLVAADRDVKMSRRAMIRQARCLRKHNIVLSDRLDELSKPTRRQLIAVWRNYADILTPEQINNLQNMLDAADPFKPDQAYEYFMNLRKQKKRAHDKEAGGKEKKKELSALCGDRRFAWVRSATVAFARGIQHRLGRPGSFELEDGMLRLSDIVLAEICSYSKMKPPSRRSRHPKAKFMCEMADKIAVWIDEILAESDERLLMMDFDEDEEVKHADEPYTDDFLNMMGGKGRRLMPPKPAYMKFTGEMLEAFKLLTDAMYKKGPDNLVDHGKFHQTYKQGADELRQAEDLNAMDYDIGLTDGISKKLDAITKPVAVGKLEQPMKDIIDICSKYLAQNAEYNKDKGEAFKYLVKKMREQPGEVLAQKGKMTMTMGQGANDLDAAKGLETDHDDPKMTQEILAKLQKVSKDHPNELKGDMQETLDKAAKYLSQKTVDDSERGPAFDKMIEILNKHGGAPFMPESPFVKTAHDAAYILKNAPGLASIKPDPAISEKIQAVLHKLVDAETPNHMLDEMPEVIKKSGDYLSGLERDRGKAQEILLAMMNKDKAKEAARRNNTAMTYGEGAGEFSASPILTPLLPIHDVQKEVRGKLDTDVASATPAELKGAMKTVTRDAGGDLSQDVAITSGVAGERYPRNLIAAGAEANGDKQLFKTGAYGMTYAEAGQTLRNAGTLEKSDDPRAVALSNEIAQKLGDNMKDKVAPATLSKLQPTIVIASQHLAKMGKEMNDALTFLMDQMNTKADEPMAKIQGIPHTYGDCVKKIIRAPTLHNDQVDKGIYETVRSKLKDLIKEHPPPPELQAKMPIIIDDVAKFLAKPLPESEEEERQLLADLLLLQGSKVFAVDGQYVMTYADASTEVKKTRTGEAAAAAKGEPGYIKVDQAKQDEINQKLNQAMQRADKPMQDKLAAHMDDKAHHLTEVVTGRGAAMGAITKEMDKKGDAPLATYDKTTLSYQEGAQAVGTAPNFQKRAAPPGLGESVEKNLQGLPVDTAGNENAAKHMQSTMGITANYVAGETGKRGGYVPPEGSEGYKPGSSAAGAGGLGAGGVGAGGVGAGGVGAGGVGAGGVGAGGVGAGGVGAGGVGAGGVGAGGVGAGGVGAGGVGAGGVGAGGVGAGGVGAGGLGAGGLGAGGLGAGGLGAGGVGAGGLGAGGADGSGGAWGARGGAGGAGGADGAGGGAGGAGAGKYGAGAGADDGPEARRARRLSEIRRRMASGERGGVQDKEHEDAKKALIGLMRKKGDDTFYKQGPIDLNHAGAADVIEREPQDVDKNIREAADTDKLARRFEKKLGGVVEGKIPDHMNDAMTDVIVESARPLAEHIIAQAYKASVQDALIDGMQRKDNELLYDQDGDTETYYYAAQRLKKHPSLTTRDVKSKLARELGKSLEEAIKCRPLPRKLAGTMKDHMKHAGDYLSEHIGNPDADIDALVDLLSEMEEAGDKLLIGGLIPKSHKDAAAYLKSLTSYENKIGKTDKQLQAEIEAAMKKLMEDVPMIGYTPDIRNKTIEQQAILLTAYLLLQAEKTEALNTLVDVLDRDPDAMILRHGSARKSHFDAARLLHGKNPDQLQNARCPDPIVARKLQIRLNNIMAQDANKSFMGAVIDDVTNYLAVHLLHPPVMKVCKCMKSVFVQCELWNEEILRRVTRPCCTCSQSRVADKPTIFTQGVQLDFKECPTMATYTRDGPLEPCPGGNQGEPCVATQSAYLLQTEPHFEPARHLSPTRWRPDTTTPGAQLAASFSTKGQLLCRSSSEMYTPSGFRRQVSPRRSRLQETTSSTSYYTADSDSSPTRFQQSPWTMFARTQGRPSAIYNSTPTRDTSPQRGRHFDKPDKSDNAPVVTTDQMSDLYAMMVSLMWNMQAWRAWLQDNLDRALASPVADQDLSPVHAYAEWSAFQKRVLKEALQWRQYIKFSRQLTLRLEHRYRDKQIVSPTRASNKTKTYLDCQREMLEITDMFNKWTQWLVAVLKETEMIQPDPYEATPLHILRWNHFKRKVESSIQDWMRYNTHLNTCWEHKYRTIMSAWEQEGPVWVMSACGAVPSGAVSAGKYNDEAIWVARTTHKSEVLPAALLPSKHCCLVYADGAVHCYTKYQVLCNADVQWVARRASTHREAAARAVCVAPGVHVGRVEYHSHYLVGAVLAPHYRCHVVIHDRPFTFDCYDLLVLSSPRKAESCTTGVSRAT